MERNEAIDALTDLLSDLSDDQINQLLAMATGMLLAGADVG